LKGWVVVGEIGLNGDVRPIPGVLAAAITCREAGRKGLMCPTANAPEAALVEGIEIVPVSSLAECIDLLRGDAARRPVDAPPPVQVSSVEDMSELRGQADAKVGAEVAAAGGHNLLPLGLDTPV
jgi:magnesium chelatase family protein